MQKNIGFLAMEEGKFYKATHNGKEHDAIFAVKNGVLVKSIGDDEYDDSAYPFNDCDFLPNMAVFNEISPSKNVKFEYENLSTPSRRDKLFSLKEGHLYKFYKGEESNPLECFVKDNRLEIKDYNGACRNEINIPMDVKFVNFGELE